MNMRFNLILTIFSVIALMSLASCKSTDEILDFENNPDSEQVNTEDYENFEIIDYNNVVGENYYFYLLANSFLNDFVDSIANKGTTDLNVYFSDDGVFRKTIGYMECIEEKNISIDFHEFVKIDEYHGYSNGDIMEIPVVVNFSHLNATNETLTKKIMFLVSVQKNIDIIGNIDWKIIDIIF